MTEVAFPEFAEFIAAAMAEFSEEARATDGVDRRQTLSDWWTAFSLVVVPERLIETAKLPLPPPGAILLAPASLAPMRQRPAL